jgi:hypothetical protein
MKIVKYLLLIAVIFVLYITAPMWTVTHGPSVIEEVEVEQGNKKAQLSTKDYELLEFENKFGKKPSIAYQSRVPKPLQEYWDNMLDESESIYDDICSPLEPSSNGWITTCQYKIKSKLGVSELKFDTYVIKHGKVLR